MARLGGRLDRLSGDGDVLFVYGTLQFPEVLTVLLGRCPERIPAQLPGWRVAALPDRVYPGLVPDPAGLAPGVLLAGLGPDDWAILDHFEDDEYDLRAVDLATGQAWTYVWTAGVMPELWHSADFASTQLAAFLPCCEQWRL
ncbi:gamma-glutamylcyclotransferase family protein [Nocardia sp. XZ_19_385]|uniref:gamma-glutamylcyclotransferase family protein n=1 Tax=Nocardia sp. XZ_19_385 TaxID=2769488 RepID=UPI00188DF07B|nr:gamma-glutamylcyclotransferase family protein [Nocardia sp. XZ_19_385]